MSSAALLDQIRAFKLIDKVEVRLSDAAGKLTRLTLLADLLVKKHGEAARDCTDAQMRESAGLRVRSAPRRRRGSADPTWEVRNAHAPPPPPNAQ